MGAVLVNGSAVGADVTVAAGAVVLGRVADGSRVQGVPAREYVRVIARRVGRALSWRFGAVVARLDAWGRRPRAWRRGCRRSPPRSASCAAQVG